MFRRTLLSAVAAAALLVASPAALAQDNYPNKPVKIIVPFPAGGTSDLMGRMVATGLQKELGQPFVVENIGGAGGTIGTARALTFAPDGYTIILTGVGSNAVAHGLDPKLTYDSPRDFIQIDQIHSGPNVLVSHPDAPFKTFKEFIDYVHKNPNKLNYGYTHAASGHMAMELLQPDRQARHGRHSVQGRRPDDERPAGRPDSDHVHQPGRRARSCEGRQAARAGSHQFAAQSPLSRYADGSRERLSGLPGAVVVGPVGAEGHAAADRRRSSKRRWSR